MGEREENRLVSKAPYWTADNFAIFVPSPKYLLDYKENTYTQESWLPGDRDI